MVNGAYPCEPCDSAPGDGLSGVAVVVDCDVFVAVVDDVALSGLDVGGGQSCQETQPENALTRDERFSSCSPNRDTPHCNPRPP